MVILFNHFIIGLFFGIVDSVSAQVIVLTVSVCSFKVKVDLRKPAIATNHKRRFGFIRSLSRFLQFQFQFVQLLLVKI